MNRMLRWLREPPRRRRTVVDWRDFGRSFGRFVGGYLDSGEKDTPAGRAWDRGGLAGGDARSTPRWMVLAGILVGIIFWGALLTFVLLVR
jgi:hypothetical protein